jgi:hypothetical protein
MTGFAFLPFALGTATTSQLVARSLAKVGPRLFSSLGPFIAAAGLLWLSRIDLQSTYWRDILGPQLVLAVGLGFIFVPLTLGATSGIKPADMGIASALLNTSQQLGGTLGLAVLVTVATTAARNWVTTHGSTAAAATVSVDAALHGYRSAFLVGAAIALIGGVVAIVALRVPAPPNATSRNTHAGSRDAGGTLSPSSN